MKVTMSGTDWMNCMIGNPFGNRNNAYVTEAPDISLAKVGYADAAGEIYRLYVFLYCYMMPDI